MTTGRTLDVSLGKQDVDPSDGESPNLRQRVKRRIQELSPGGVIFLILTPIIVLPILLIFYASLSTEPPRAGHLTASFTGRNFSDLLSTSLVKSAWNTVVIGLGGTLLAMAIGATLAWLAARTDVPGKRIIQVAGVVPLFISALVGALAWSMIGSPKFGYINLLFHAVGLDVNFNVYSLPGIVLVLGLYNAPYTFMFSYAAFTMMNPELEEAASLHGASNLRVARLITLPLVTPALLSSAILTAILVIGDFPVPFILGSGRISTLPTDLYLMISTSPTQPDKASALSAVIVVSVVGLIFAQRWISARRDYTTVTGKGMRSRAVRLGWARWPAFGFVLLYLLLAVVAPYFALIETSLRKSLFTPNLGSLFDLDAFSLDTYRNLEWGGAFGDALVRTVELAIVAAVVCGVLSFVISYFVHRTRYRGRGVIDYTTNLPLALPALVIGIGLLWTFLSMPFPIYGTLAALGVAFVACFIPHAYRSMSATMTQIHPELEESATMCGAGRVRVMTYVIVPLLKAGIISTVLLLIIMCFRELSAALFLYTPHTEVVSIAIFQEVVNGNLQAVAAMSIVYSTILLALTIGGWRFLGRGTNVG